MLLHTQVIEKEGRKEFVVLPYEEFVQIQEALDDFEGPSRIKEGTGRVPGGPHQKS